MGTLEEEYAEDPRDYPDDASGGRGLEGEEAYSRTDGYTRPDGSVEAVWETNDNYDWGVANEYATLTHTYKDAKAFLEDKGASHRGISGIQVDVFLDGEKVTEEVKRRVVSSFQGTGVGA